MFIVDSTIEQSYIYSSHRYSLSETVRVYAKDNITSRAWIVRNLRLVNQVKMR